MASSAAAPIFFFLLGIFIKGQLALIETEEAVWTTVGEDAPLSCRLTEAKDVLQVTWQKVLPDGEKNLATYTKKFGSRVRPDLEEKMDFHNEALQSCSMVIRKVTEQDEACYRCLFNTYSEGALIGRTCLKLYELHDPILDVMESNSPPESLVSCSATGRPAPIVILTVSQQNLTFSQYNSSRVTNTNGTVTVTTTALLSASSSTQVRCSVSVNSAALRERLVTVPGLTETPGDDGLEKQSGSSHDERQESEDLNFPLILGAVAVAGAVACCGLAIFTHWRCKKDKNKDDENNKTPIKPAPMDGIKTPLVTVTNETRRRSSTKKRPENKSFKASPSVAKRLLMTSNLTDQYES